MASIQQLPSELLAEIFQSYSALQHCRDEVIDLWILGQVCHDWRLTALSTPRLWNYLQPVVIEDCHYPSIGKLREKIDEALHRSGQLPLTFQLHILKTLEGDTEEAANFILPSFLQAASRWKDVVIRVPSLKVFHDHFGNFQGQLPLLQTILFCIAHCRRRIVTHGLFKFLGGAPNLRQIGIDLGKHSYNWDVIEDIPWLPLERYTERAGLIHSFPQVVQTAPNLRVLNYAGTFQYKFAPSRHIRHCHLQRLVFECLISRDLEVLTKHFEHISLPSLEALTIGSRRDTFYEQTDIFPLITTLITNSSCPLKRLTVSHNLSSSLETMVQLFVYLPSLEELDLGECPPTSSGDSKVPSVLAYDKDKPTLLPNLASLRLTYRGDVTCFDAEAISQLVSSRARAVQATDIGLRAVGWLGCPLTKVKISIHDSDRKARYRTLYYLENMDSPLFDLLEPPIFPNTNQDVIDLVHKTQEAAKGGIEMNHQWTRQLLATVDLIHVVSCFYPRPGQKYDLLMQLQKQQLLAHLEPWITRRRWMLAGYSDILYITPDHAIRRSPRRWDLVLGGDSDTISSVMDSKSVLAPCHNYERLGLQ